MQYFVDTNVVPRLVTADHKAEHLRCKRLFEQAKEGQRQLVTSSLVIFELVWTLGSYYNLSKKEISEIALGLLNFNNLHIEHRDIFYESLLIWSHTNVDFNDAFNYTWARKKKVSNIYSYDKHFDRLPEIKRLEP